MDWDAWRQRVDDDSGGVTVRNLATPPDSHVDVQRSEAAAAGTWGTRWFGDAPAHGTVRVAPADAGSDRSYFHKTWTTGTDRFIDIGADYLLAVEPGKTYTASADVRSSWDTQNGVMVEFWDDRGRVVRGAANYAGAAPSAPGTWQRPATTFTVPDDARRALLIFGPWPSDWNLHGKPTLAGSTVDVTRLLATEGTALYPYFDGDTK